MSFRELTSAGLDQRLKATKIWKEANIKGGAALVEDMLEFAIGERDSDCSIIHLRGLRQRFLDTVKDIGPGIWIESSRIIGDVRNQYLQHAVRPEQASRYQERHKHAPFPTLATPDVLRRSLQKFIVSGLARVGMVELAVHGRDSNPWAFRLSRIGAETLGLKFQESEAPTGISLVVNPDHEIVVFPENATPQLIHDIGRFAIRKKADFALHYQLSQESIQEAAATGMTAEEILGVLDEHGRHELPENVAFSINEWCEKMIAARSRRVWIIETKSKKELDRILSVNELLPFVKRRLNDTVVEISEDPTEAGIVTLLRDRGIFVDTGR